jgi:hypothetical protein
MNESESGTKARQPPSSTQPTTRTFSFGLLSQEASTVI